MLGVSCRPAGRLLHSEPGVGQDGRWLDDVFLVQPVALSGGFGLQATAPSLTRRFHRASLHCRRGTEFLIPEHFRRHADGGEPCSR